ncbi:MAG TPA: alpha/beta hydrolase [Actinocrinis sp.]|jgi:pimeloyl-ACP methyl ester carboxylesterase
MVPVGDRELAVECSGAAEGGVPVFLLHGTPGSRIGPRPRGIVLERMGVRLISYDRPGYGHSTRAPGRKVVDACKDVLAIADHLKIERFCVVGRSGGGPHALACAASARDRVVGAAVLVSVAPADASGLDWLDGMTDLNADSYQQVDRLLAKEGGRGGLLEGLDARALLMAEDPDSLVRFLLPDLAASDRRIVEDPAMRELLVDTYAEAVREGSGGWIDDALALRRPWGFKIADVECPVLLWHGDDDRFSPAAHTRWLYEQLRSTRVDLSEVQLRIVKGAAHFAAFETMPDVLNWLAETVRKAAQTEPPPDAAGTRAGVRAAAGAEAKVGAEAVEAVEAVAAG